MANNTKTTIKNDVMGPTAMLATERDFKDALLMVSITANLFILCLWVALQVTTAYDAALTSFFFDR